MCLAAVRGKSHLLPVLGAAGGSVRGCNAEDGRPVEVLAYNEWGGSRSLPELLAAFVLPNYWLILAGLVNGYAFAWIGHFFIEKNRPATFKYPLKSFLCDWYMLFCILTFRIGGELKKLQSPGQIVSEPETVAS